MTRKSKQKNLLSFCFVHTNDNGQYKERKKSAYLNGQIEGTKN